MNYMHLLPLMGALLLAPQAHGQTGKQEIVTADVDHYWQAYDAITRTKDPVQQARHLDQLYLSKGSEGLKGLMAARRYTPQEYLDAIDKYPKFWKSIRPNMAGVHRLRPQIERDIRKLRKFYPALTPATIYFSVGSFRTNGTIKDGRILIGSEMALASPKVDRSELPEALQYFYSTFNPIKDIGLLCAHEYVHTQQKEPMDDLLSAVLYEGIAEFVSTQATGKPSFSPAIEFGRKNRAAVLRRFEKDLFVADRMYNWIWGLNRNELKERDLGYYVGFEIAQRHYAMASDKAVAVRELVELDFSSPNAIRDLVDRTRFLSKPVEQLRQDYENSMPWVRAMNVESLSGLQMKPAQGRKVPYGPVKITLQFSEAMNKERTGFDFGPQGEARTIKVKNVLGFSEDGKTFRFEADLLPGRDYELLVSSSFRTPDGIRLRPYLIRVTTTASQ